MSAIGQRYRFYLTSDAETREIFPVQSDVEVQWTQESERLFFRQEIKDGLLLRGDDYTWALAIEEGDNPCQEIIFEVYKIVQGSTDVLRLKGRTYTQNWNFDKSRCEIVVKVESQDEYTALTNIWEEERNVYDTGADVAIYTAWTSIASPISYIEEFGPTEETISLGFPGNQTFANPDWPDLDQGWVIMYDEVIIDGDIISGVFATRKTRFKREVAFAENGPIPAGGAFIGGWKAVDVVSPSEYKWARFVSAPKDTDFGSENLRQFGTAPGFWYYNEYTRFYRWVPGDHPIYPFAVPISAVFNRLLSGTGLSLRSNFFNIDPDGSEPSNDVYDNNVWLRTFLIPKSNCLNPDASNPSTTIITSLKNLLNELRNTYNVYEGFIDGVLYVEHLSFWQSRFGIDFTTSDYSKALEGNNAYSYDTGTPVGERWFHLDESPSQAYFKRTEITYRLTTTEDYPQNCLVKTSAVAEINTNNACNDISEMASNPSGFTNGTKYWAFVSGYEYEGQFIMYAFEGVLNYVCAPVYLRRLFRWGRWFEIAQVIRSSGLEYFSAETVKRRKRQRELSVFLPDMADFDPIEQQQTQLGWGDVDSASYSFAKGVLRLALKFVQ